MDCDGVGVEWEFRVPFRPNQAFLVEAKKQTVDHPVNIKQAETTTREEVANCLPELVGEEASDVEAFSVEFMKDNIEAELSQLSPDNSARMRSSRTTLSSEDTSGEIFSAGERQE